MVFTEKIRHAVNFSIVVHEEHQKQKRTGKDVPYITHPLLVGLILADAGASEDIVVAGILHDTIEDSIPLKKVTKEMIAVEFGEHVADLVESVTEDYEELSWEKKKKDALLHMKSFTHDSRFLKSADVIANTTEIISDHELDGDDIFSRFGGGKTRFIEHYLNVIDELNRTWDENPLHHDLMIIDSKLRTIGGI